MAKFALFCFFVKCVKLWYVICACVCSSSSSTAL